MVIIDPECLGCLMKVCHVRHDKDLRRKNKNKSYNRIHLIHVDWKQVRVKNNFGVSVVSKKHIRSQQKRRAKVV